MTRGRWFTLRHRPRVGDEAGITLIELLVAMVIMPMIVGAIAFAFIEILSQQSSVSKAIADSADAQVLSANYIQDVHGAQQITTNSTVSGQCGSSGTQLLGLEWGGYLAPGSGTEAYQTVVSYDRVPAGATYSLMRYYCASGPSATPTTTTTVSSDIPSTPGTPSVQPSTGPSSPGVLAANGWTSTVGVTGVSLTLTEPGSSYTYSLTGDPAGAEQGQQSSIAVPSSNCGMATPGTGTYTASLCFVDFSGFNWASAKSGSWCTSQGLSGTPFILRFCVSASGVQVGGAAIPTFYNPQQDSSEAFLGNNGFYTGIPGDPALYQCSTGATLPVGCPTGVGSGTTTISFSSITVLNPSGQPATGWQLVTGDSESTDTGEWIAWSTCPTTTAGAGTGSVNGGPPNNQIYSGSATCPGSEPNLVLLPNSPTSQYGNACTYPGYTGGSVSGTYLEWTNPGGITPANPGATSSLECAENNQSNKTGTVMLEAAAPSTLTVNMHGAGAEGIFIGVLLQ